MSRLMRDGAGEPVSQDQILRRERGQGNIHFSCSADHVQGWQPYLTRLIHTLTLCATIHTYTHSWVPHYGSGVGTKQYNIGEKLTITPYINGMAGANTAVNTPRLSRGTRVESCDFIVLIGDP